MTTVTQLDSYFTNLITELMKIEQRPLTNLVERRDSISLQNSAYQTMSTHLNELQDLTQTLIETDVSFALKANRSVSINPSDNDDTVMTASVTSKAGVGDYEVAVTQLAQAQRQASAVQSSADQALGLSGTFWMGGTGTAGASVTPNATVTGVGTSALVQDLAELGTQTYTVEVREQDGSFQFRLKDVDGEVVAIADQDDDPGETTTNWQDVTTGTIDTGRGLTIDFSSTPSAGTTEIDYTAAGVSVSVSSDDSLLDVANLINDANQPTGRDMHATVVGTQLVLTAANTGTAHTMIYNDGVGLGFTGVDIQTARDASFSVNDISFTRSSNAITDVINGVTMNLAADAEGKTAIMSVTADMETARGTIDNFIAKFNETLGYIEKQSSVISNGDNTYTRGTLASDTVFSDLRSNLLFKLMSKLDGSGEYDRLKDIGVTINDSLQVTVEDEDLLTDALANNLDEVVDLFTGIMQDVDTMLGRFTGVNGYMNNAKDGISNQLSDVNDDIERMEGRLDDKQELLITQYSQLQAQLYTMQYTQSMMSSLNQYG